jgi:hypothetical protein
VGTEIVKVKDTVQVYIKKLQHSLQLQNSSRKASYMVNFLQVNFRGHKKATKIFSS